MSGRRVRFIFDGLSSFQITQNTNPQCHKNRNATSTVPDQEAETKTIKLDRQIARYTPLSRNLIRVEYINNL